MCKNLKMCKNPDADDRGGFGNSDTLGQGEGGWFENPRFWRTSFVDGPLVVSTFKFAEYIISTWD